jgi:hypothetical protein
MNNKLLWLSRHPPTEQQIGELRRFNTTIEIKQIAKSFNNAKEIVDLVVSEKADTIVAVLPVNLLADLVKFNIHPIRAVMSRHINKEGEAEFTHQYFEVVDEINIQTHKLI